MTLAFPKPTKGTSLIERRQRRLARKAGVEAETHEQMLIRIEFWRLLRIAVFMRDGGKCRACGMQLFLNDPDDAPQSLHTHHVIHKSAGGLDVIDNLIALCRDDHKRHHDGRLSISGPVNAISFVLRTLKGTLVRAWESVLTEALASSVKLDAASASTQPTEPTK